MFVPVHILAIAAVAAFMLVVLLVVAVAAWFGIAHEHNALLARVKVMQIDVYDLKPRPLRRVGGPR